MSDEISTEDLLRLQVLLSQEIKAVRLDDGNMALVALTDKGEASVPLHPTCREDRYMRLVRELLSGHALGSPGGYPVYLSRWTRHGQMETENLGKLLLTGEPEAVVAVVHSPSLTDEIAEYAWWAMPTIENARLMMRREAVAHGRMGKVLADFLVEHLPFLQDDHLGMMDTVMVLLASGVLTEEQRLAVWRRGKRTNSFYVAFLEQAGLGLPGAAEARRVEGQEKVEGLAATGNVAAAMLLDALSVQGQLFLTATDEVLDRPETQEVVNRLFNAIGQRFRPDGTLPGESLPGLAAARAECPELESAWQAIDALAQVTEGQVIPIFARSTAIGSLMRRKLEPVVKPLRAHIAVLRGR